MQRAHAVCARSSVQERVQAQVGAAVGRERNLFLAGAIIDHRRLLRGPLSERGHIGGARGGHRSVCANDVLSPLDCDRLDSACGLELRNLPVRKVLCEQRRLEPLLHNLHCTRCGQLLLRLGAVGELKECVAQRQRDAATRPHEERRGRLQKNDRVCCQHVRGRGG
jgi:hypothetical protein